MRNITFAGNPVNLLGEEIKEGTKAPAFTAVNQDLSQFNFSDDDKKIKVISVAPSIDTDVCAIQTKRFNHEASKFADDVEIITITLDLPFAQGRYCGAEGIDNISVVSDYQQRDFGMKYGFLIEGLMLLARGVLVIDRDHTIKYVEYVEEITNEPDYDKALEVVKALV